MNELTQRAYDFYKESAKPVLNRNDAFSITQGDYTKFMTQNGVTVEVMKRIDEIKTAMTSAAIEYCDDVVETLIEKAKASGGNPREAKASLRIAVGAKNRDIVTVAAEKTYPNIHDGSNVIVNGVVTLKHVRNGYIDDAVRAANEERIKALL